MNITEVTCYPVHIHTQFLVQWLWICAARMTRVCQSLNGCHQIVKLIQNATDWGGPCSSYTLQYYERQRYFLTGFNKVCPLSLTSGSSDLSKTFLLPDIDSFLSDDCGKHGHFVTGKEPFGLQRILNPISHIIKLCYWEFHSNNAWYNELWRMQHFMQLP
jgi:hypothetical protein